VFICLEVIDSDAVRGAEMQLSQTEYEDWSDKPIPVQSVEARMGEWRLPDRPGRVPNEIADRLPELIALSCTRS
jgi:hypothetical protein